MFFIYQAECCISTDSLRNKREEVSLEGKVSLEAGCKSLNQASERDGGSGVDCTKGTCELWGGPLLPFAHFSVCEVLLQK